MVTKSKKEKSGQKKRVKVLNIKKETVKDLTGNEAKGIKGGTTQCIVRQSFVANSLGIRHQTYSCVGQSLISGAQSF